MIFLITNKQERLKWVAIPQKYEHTILPGFTACFGGNEQADCLMQKIKVNDSKLHIIRILPKKHFTFQFKAARHFIALKYISKGTLEIRSYPQQLMGTGACSLSYYPAGHPIDAYIQNEIEIVILECTAKIMERLSPLVSKYVRAYRQKDPTAIISNVYPTAFELKLVFEEMLNHQFKHPLHAELYIAEKTSQIMRLMAVRLEEMKHQTKETAETFSVYLAMENFIQNNLDKTLNIKILGKEFGLCRSGFYAIFNQHCKNNITVGQYILQAKMEKAASLLIESTMSISEIAYWLTYMDPSGFHKAFLKYHNCTPGEYRADQLKAKLI